ncbi:MAG: hypothetical protein KDD82_14020 [Planctomycetes bacterium]|nr:hypothetical protein [Planctomycetota bacterium]
MDPRLRELERRWRASGSFADGHAYALALTRARAAPLDLCAEVLASTPADARALLLGEPRLEPVPLDLALPDGLRLLCVRLDLWQYTTITLLFAELDGVSYLLPPWRGRGTLDRLPVVLWPTADEVGVEARAGWRAAVSYTYFAQRGATDLPADPLVELDLAQLLAPRLAALVRAGDLRGLAPWFGLLDVLYHQTGYRSQELHPGAVHAPGHLPADLQAYAAEAPQPFEARGEQRAARCYVHKLEGLDGWSGERERLSVGTLTLEPSRWRYASADLLFEEDRGLALS